MGRYSATESNAIDLDNRAMNNAGVPMSAELEEIFDTITNSSFGSTAAWGDIDSISLGGGAFSVDTNTTAGLTFGYQAGRFHNGSALVNVAAGTVVLTPSTINYVEVDRA